MSPNATERLVAQIAAEFRRRMQGEYVPRIRQCLASLDDLQVWHRHGAAGNSVGNLLLHLAGNITQWILVSFAGVADRRERPAEFAARGGASGLELVERLAAVIDQACAAVDRLTVAELLAVRTVQQRYQETGIGIVLHVLEHCSGHAGQIYAFTKLLTGRDLRFYDL